MKKRGLLRICFAGVLGTALFLGLKKLIDLCVKIADKSYRMETYTSMYDKWFTIRETDNKLEKYLIDNHVHTVAIYGMGNLGIHLFHDFKNLNTVEVLYGIDRSVEKIAEDIVIYKPEDSLPEVDLVIVTAIFSYDAIADLLRKKMSCPIISLKEFIEEM